jgi:hypothetical protein
VSLFPSWAENEALTPVCQRGLAQFTVTVSCLASCDRREAFRAPRLPESQLVLVAPEAHAWPFAFAGLYELDTSILKGAAPRDQRGQSRVAAAGLKVLDGLGGRAGSLGKGHARAAQQGSGRATGTCGCNTVVQHVPKMGRALG